jgi:cholesterol oxidase
LDDHRTQPVKFIVSPSVVLPVSRVGLVYAEERLALDSWSGYPRSLFELLQWIDAAGINGVVFLSGDLHLSMACKLVLESGRTVYSVVSSGMYTPWPFANARPEDFVLGEALVLERDRVSLAGRMVTGLVSSEAGYAALTFSPKATANGHATLKVEFRSHDGNVKRTAYDLSEGVLAGPTS